MPTLGEATEEHMNERSGVWMNKIFCEDCLEGLAKIPDKTANFLFTDPPYNLGKDYGVYKDDLTQEEYISWMESVITEARRITGDNICFFISYKRVKLFWDLIPDARLVVVHKRAIGSYDSDYFRQYYGLLTTAKPVKRSYDLWKDVRLPSEGYFFREKRYNHPAFTSESLTRKVIKTYTNPGDLIVDPFMGTGTTAVTCKKLGRNYVGFEINPDYVEISEDRLSNISGLVDVVEWFE